MNTIPMPRARLWRAYLAEARCECLRALRAPSFAIPFLALPVALYLFFGVYLVAGMSHNDPKAALCMFVNFAVFAVMGPALFGFGLFVSMEREQGLLTLKRALPMPPASYLAAKMTMAMSFSALVMLTLIAAAVALGDVRLTFGQFLALAAIDIAGSLPFCAIGLFIGTSASAKSAPAIANLTYLPMMYLGGLFLPMPKSVQPVEFASPAFYLDKLGLIVAGVPSLDQLSLASPPGHGAPLLHVAALVGFTVVFAGLALRRFSRVR